MDFLAQASQIHRPEPHVHSLAHFRIFESRKRPFERTLAPSREWSPTSHAGLWARRQTQPDSTTAVRGRILHVGRYAKAAVRALIGEVVATGDLREPLLVHSALVEAPVSPDGVWAADQLGTLRPPEPARSRKQARRLLKSLLRELAPGVVGARNTRLAQPSRVTVGMPSAECVAGTGCPTSGCGFRGISPICWSFCIMRPGSYAAIARQSSR